MKFTLIFFGLATLFTIAYVLCMYLDVDGFYVGILHAFICLHIAEKVAE